ncbi:hypothetical protein ACFLTU_08835, partial [Bacteroidota bacterium]
YTVKPGRLDLVVPPRSSQPQLITIQSASSSKIDLAALPFIEIELKGAYMYDEVIYDIPVRRKLIFNWKYILPEYPDAERIMKSQFENPDTADFTSLLIPGYLHNKWYWYSREDCLLHFKLYRDKKYLYLLAIIQDDQLVMNDSRDRDLLYVDLEDKNGASSHLTIFPDPHKSILQSGGQTELGDEDVQLIGSLVEKDLIKISLRVPISKIARPDNSFRFNIGYRDQDNKPVRENSTLYWKPLWGSETDYQYSGTFLLNNQN